MASLLSPPSWKLRRVAALTALIVAERSPLQQALMVLLVDRIIGETPHTTSLIILNLPFF